MKKNIKKFLICAFVSVIGVVSFCRLELDEPNKEVVAQGNETLDTWGSIDNVTGASGHIVDVTVNEEPIVSTPPLEFKDGWLKTSVNVRKEPNIESEVLEVFKFNQQIKYADFNEEWVQIEYNDSMAYIYKAYVSDTFNTYKEFTVPQNRGFKSFEPYHRFNPKYRQYKLQQYASTDEYGLRKVDGRYCVALGTYFFENVSNDIIGTYFDLILENGTVIPCILGDIKADAHTDANHIMTANGCLSEFIVDKSKLTKDIKSMGNVSYAKKEWRSPVAKVIVYDKNFFDGQ